MFIIVHEDVKKSNTVNCRQLVPFQFLASPKQQNSYRYTCILTLYSGQPKNSEKEQNFGMKNLSTPGGRWGSFLHRPHGEVGSQHVKYFNFAT